jgi:GTP-binding protein
MPPVIAIVGRPNVGKSTLFNRLTSRRSALVSDTPGLTRDRREGEALLDGNTVVLIDTAGLEEAAPGSIAGRMRAQSEAALAKADLVLFVLDARDGVVPADAAFAQVVRETGRPVVLVANKSEGRAGAEGFYEAFRLGLGEPVAISAEHGEGIGELVATMLAALGLNPARKREDGGEGTGAEPDGVARPIRVAIVGRPNSGKSTLVNALLGEERMITGPAGAPVRYGGAAPQGAHHRDGREALRFRQRACDPLRRGGGAAHRRRASAGAPGPHHRRPGGGGRPRHCRGRQQMGSGA